MKNIFNQKSLSLLILGVVSLLAIVSLFLMFSKAGLTGRSTDDASTNFGSPRCCVNTQTGAFITIPLTSATDAPPCPAPYSGDTGFPSNCEIHTASFRKQLIQPVAPQPTPSISQPVAQPITPISATPVLNAPCDIRVIANRVIGVCEGNRAVGYYCNAQRSLSFYSDRSSSRQSDSRWQIRNQQECPSGCEIVNDQAQCKLESQKWDFLPCYQPGESVYEGVNEDCNGPEPAHCCIKPSSQEYTMQYPCPAPFTIDKGVQQDCSKVAYELTQQRPPSQFNSLIPLPSSQLNCCINSKYNAEWTSQSPCPAGFIDKGVQNDCSTIAAKLKQEMAPVQPITPTLPSPQPIKPVQPTLPVPTIAISPTPTSNNGLSSSQGQLPVQPTIPDQPVSQTPVLGASCDRKIITNKVIGVCEGNKAVNYYCKEPTDYGLRGITSRRPSTWQIIKQEECPSGCEIVDNAQCKLWLPEYQPGESVYEGVNEDSTPEPQKQVQPVIPTLSLPPQTPQVQPTPTNGLSSSQGQLPATPIVSQPQLPTQPVQPSLPSQPQPPESTSNLPVIGENCNFIQLSAQNNAVQQVCDNSYLVTLMCAPTLAFSSGNWNEVRRETCAKGCETVNNKAECKRPAVILSDQAACGNGGVINKYYNNYVSAENCITNKWGTRFDDLLVWRDDEWSQGPSGVFGASNSCSDDLNIKISYCGAAVIDNPKAKYACIKKEPCRQGTKCKKRDLTQDEIGMQGCAMHFSGGKCTVSECI